MSDEFPPPRPRTSGGASAEVALEGWKRQIDWLLTLDRDQIGGLLVDICVVVVARGGEQSPSAMLRRCADIGDDLLAEPGAVALVKARIAQIQGGS